MPIKNEILQNLEAKSEENVEQKPTKWKEFKTKHRTTAKIITVTKGVATGAAVGDAITFGIDAAKKFDEKQKRQIEVDNDKFADKKTAINNIDSQIEVKI